MTSKLIGAPSRTAIATQTAAMISVLDERHPRTRAALAADPIKAILSWGGIAVKIVPDQDADPACSVPGAYLGDQSPVILAVAATTSLGRRAFTALHELGHDLQRTDAGLAEYLLAQPDQGYRLEEAACNAFAASILIPEDLVTSHIPSVGPTAADIRRLWLAGSASRAAVCVRAAERLTSPGHVVLIDRSGVVQFAAAHQLPPIRKATDLSTTQVVRSAIRSSTSRTRGVIRMLYRDGIVGAELTAETGDLGADYLVVVAVTDHAPWMDRFTLPSAESGPQGRAWICGHCDHEFRTFEPPCQCGGHKCPACGRCDCAPKVAERYCTECFLKLPAHLFDGASTRCRECS